MKKIIKGLLYDTEDSELIYIDEDKRRMLYMTKNKHFFTLYNNGEIVPKSVEDTKEYLGSVDVEKYIEIFGEPEEA